MSIEDCDEIGKFPLSHVLKMFVLVRAITYAALFIGLLFIYLPGRLLVWSGAVQPAVMGTPQIAGMIVGGVGAAIALWCISTFAVFGRGTPAPFDPPRRLVTARPYRFVRDPMYIGAGLGLAGAAFFYLSLSMAIYVATFFLAAHSFVVFYEEPTLRRTFGAEYEAYCRRVRRWWPGCRRKNVKAFRLRTKLQRDEYGSLLKLRTYGHAEGASLRYSLFG